MQQSKSKPPNSPTGSARDHAEQLNGFRNHVDVLNVRTDTYSIANNAVMAENTMEIVRTHQDEWKMQNSPNMHKVAMTELYNRCRRLSTDGINMYIAENSLINTISRKFGLGWVKFGDEAIEQSIEGEKACNGNSDGSSDDDGKGKDKDEDETMRNSDNNLMWVEEALLAGGSQYMCQTQRMQNNTLPVLSGSHTKYPEGPYGVCRHRWQCERLKIKHINNYQVLEKNNLPGIMWHTAMQEPLSQGFIKLNSKLQMSVEHEKAKESQ